MIIFLVVVGLGISTRGENEGKLLSSMVEVGGGGGGSCGGGKTNPIRRPFR